MNQKTPTYNLSKVEKINILGNVFLNKISNGTITVTPASKI